MTPGTCRSIIPLPDHAPAYSPRPPQPCRGIFFADDSRQLYDAANVSCIRDVSPNIAGFSFGTPLPRLPPYPPRKAARCRWKPIALTNMDNRSRGAAEHVQFLVVGCCGRAVTGLVFFLVGHWSS